MLPTFGDLRHFFGLQLTTESPFWIMKFVMLGLIEELVLKLGLDLHHLL